MTKEEIIEMVRQSGFNVEQGFLLRVTGIDEDLERFAKLIAQHEREECAKIADEWSVAYPHPSKAIAETIQARGQE